MISNIKKQVKGAVVLGALLMGSSAFAQLGITWSEMGPNDVAGRTRSIIVDKTDPTGKKLYAAGVSGGIFRTLDGGSNWTQVNDTASSLIVSSMGQDAAGNVYFGTGESFGRGGDGAGLSGFVGTGLYKLFSNNSVGRLQDSALFGNINEIAVASTNTIYVASDKGFFISTNGGTTFTEEDSSLVANIPAMDVKMASNGDIYYSAGVKTSSTSAVWYRAFGSTTFTKITPTTITNRGRIEIAPSPADPNYVYLSIAKAKTSLAASGGLSAVLVSSDKGTTWNVITLGTSQFDPFISGTTGYGDYANTIAADPVKKDACYLGGEVFYFWNQIASNPLGQGTWTQIGTNFPIPFAIYIHSKIHDVKFNGGNNSMYIATDGGIYKSVSGNSGFLPYNNGFNISQFNAITFPIFPRVNQTPSTSTLAPYAGIAGGSVGNSLTYLSGAYSNGPLTSTSFGSSDGFQADFSRINPKAIIYSGANGTIFRTNDIDIAPPSTFYDNSYRSGGTGGPGAPTFANENTPMRLLENYNNRDSSMFVNDAILAFIPVNSNTQTKFTVTNLKEQRDHRYEKVTITTVSTKLLLPTPSQTITIVPVYNGPNKIVSHVVTGNANTSSVLNNRISLSTFTSVPSDSIYFEFSTAPKDSTKITVRTDLSFQTTDMGVTSTLGTNKSATTQTFGIATSIRAKRKYHYTNMLVSIVSTKSVAPLPTQTINIAVSPYTGNSIPLVNQVVTGAFGTANIYLNNTTLKDSVFISCVSAPDSCRFDLSCDYITYDSIIVKNTDVSNYNFETGQLITGSTSTTLTPAPIIKLPLMHSARLAVGLTQTVTATGPSVFAVKRPLNFSINPDWVKIAGKSSRTDSAGGVPYKISTMGTHTITGTSVTRLEWSPSGRYIYFSTKLNDTTHFLYRISHLEFIGDSSSADYSGIYSSDIDSTFGGNPPTGSALRKSVRQRTTPIGKFKYPITGIAIADNDTMLMITCGGYKNKTGTVYYSNSGAATMNFNNTDDSYFSIKNGSTLPFMPCYTGIFEMSDNKKALVGTENGIFSTLDITSATPTWFKESGGKFPNVPVFQLRQQTYPSYKCYNSGIIYAATHGRGVWSTDDLGTAYGIGIQELENESFATGSNIKLYPNPAADATTLLFKTSSEASFKITVYDINGRVMIQEATSKLMEGTQHFTINTAQLTSGIYFVTVAGSNNFNANSKLVITH